MICVPPPNVTGELHMGHALNGSMQDCLIRWHRMRGFDTLWQPGYDHAGISTQNVVEKQLLAEGTSRQEIGREAFLERTWAWLESTGRTIMGQFRQLGCSLDYSRERFTMDDGYVESVMTAFVRLWDAGWIYRANRIVNWCPYHQTAISDLEVEHVELDDALTYARYPFADGPLRTAPRRSRSRPCGRRRSSPTSRWRCTPTTRATRDAVGRDVIVPVVGRRVPVIADARVEPEFGSGALKITPGHDPKDFEIGRDHGLETLTVIGPDGRMTAEGFEGLDQKEADRRVVDWLKEHGQLEKRESIHHAVAHLRALPLPDRAARLAAVVVPDGRARRARDRGARGAARPLPPREPAPVRDRVARERPRLVRLAPALVGPPDPDLDVPGRPPHLRLAAARCLRRVRLGRARARDRRAGHLVLVGPLALRDARLAERDPGARPLLPGERQRDRARDHPPLGEPDDLLGLFLLGEVPFTDVIITSTVLALDGRRMSKSLGTGIDPLEAVAKHGADATRYGLLKISSTQDVRFSWDKIEEGGKLANKLWNVARLILQNAGGISPELRPDALEETLDRQAGSTTRGPRSRSCCRGSTSPTSSTCSTT